MAPQLFRPLLLVSLLALLGLLLPRRIAAAVTRPNIVLILADDVGWDDVGYHGSVIRTPSLDRLATAGVRLDRLYALPLCTPSRAALMTGRYPIRQGLQSGVINAWDKYGLPLEERTLAQALREAGYQTAILGKWHLGMFAQEYLPMQRGFDHQYGMYDGRIGYYSHQLFGGLDWHRDEEPLYEEGYSTTLIGDEAARVIRGRDPNRPFFLYVAFNSAHQPLEVPDQFTDGYRSLRGAERLFAGMITCMDEEIGKIAATLQQEGLSNDTIVIFASDNGAKDRRSDRSPLQEGKHSLHEGGVRVPALVAWPGRLLPRAVEAPVHLVDLYPTLLAVAGSSLEQALPLDGRSAWPVLTGVASSIHSDLLINAEKQQGAIVQGPWKLIVSGPLPRPKNASNRQYRVELFNVETDISERRNLASRNPALVRDLFTRLDGYATEALPPKGADFEHVPPGLHVPPVWGPTPQ